MTDSFNTKFGAGNFVIGFDNEDQFGTCFGRVTRVQEGETYPGPYEALPDPLYDQGFPTQGKLMSADMVFRKIPYAEVGNEFGGNTVTIG